MAIIVGHNFTVRHLVSAAHFTQLCIELEKQPIIGDVVDALALQHAYTSSAVILSMAFLEGQANSYFEYPQQVFPALNGPASEQLIDLVDKQDCLKKYRAILAFRGKAALDESNAVKNMRVLKHLRNLLVHPRLLWTAPPRHIKKLAKEKSAEALASRLAQAGIKSNPLLPSEPLTSLYQYFSSNCAEWALSTAVQFMNEFSLAAELQNPLSKHIDKLAVSR